jgi:hypothetical protein
MARFPIAFSKWMTVLMQPLGLGPAHAWIDLDAADIEVQVGWGFRTRFPRSAVRTIEPSETRLVSQGIHGRGGHWRVNGTPDRVVRISLAPEQQARALGRRVRLSTLEVSLEDPDAFRSALRGP